MKRLDRYVFLARNLVAGLPLGYALVSTRWEQENDLLNWSIAIPLCAAGIAMRAWASEHCNYAQRKPGRLATTGPYAFVRNPLYVGNLLIITAATIASELVWMVPLAVLWAWGAYHLVSEVYERPFMIRRYGEDYRRYRERVPAWIPHRLRGMPSFSWHSLLANSARIGLLLPFALKEFGWFGLG